MEVPPEEREGQSIQDIREAYGVPIGQAAALRNANLLAANNTGVNNFWDAQAGLISAQFQVGAELSEGEWDFAGMTSYLKDFHAAIDGQDRVVGPAISSVRESDAFSICRACPSR